MTIFVSCKAHFIEYVYLVLIILALVMLANKLRIAYPIVLVLGGLILSFTSSLSHITIDPELVFFIFLPPLLYEAAWQTSWKEFWKWRRVITSFAFPVVIITVLRDRPDFEPVYSRVQPGFGFPAGRHYITP
jgi:CPA1 family monovalent cation:H+ antiporter